MKLSLLVYTYKQKNELNIFLENCTNQIDENFEIILSLNKPTLEELEIIYKYKKKLENKIQVLINDKRQMFSSEFIKMLNLAKGEYIAFINPSTFLESEFTQLFSTFSNKHKADMIEFKPSYKGFFEIELRQRIAEKKVFNLKEEKKVLAYILPIIFNKFFNREKFIKILPKLENKNISNSKIWIDLVFKFLLNTETYVYINTVLISDFNEKNFVNNPSALIKEWDGIEKYIKNEFPDFIQEIQYNKIYNLALFLPGILNPYTKHRIKNFIFKNHLPTSISRFYKKIKDMKVNEFFIIISLNKYFLDNDWEKMVILKDLAPNKWKNLTRKL
ncbi:glycosyltransferase [Mesomycoplasma neurolyticum]|uniref:Putative glycosyl transferase n=1 Tax=Mesomycoplasma neurolyticum TaxID=2120 RepID=A0A449A4D1_9BACT|nr:glycosyltransferase [Mesomycoplasma neurolyticum]VEU59096.1 putative glycosyl transferase [Mesomycoplasma neurolyticum]